MKSTILLFLFTFFSTGDTCIAAIRGRDILSQEAQLLPRLEVFTNLFENTIVNIEKALVMRLKANEFYTLLKTKLDTKKDRPLTSNEIALIHFYTTNYKEIRSEILHAVRSYRKYISRYEISFEPTSPTLLKDQKEWWQFYKKEKKLTLSPHDKLGMTYILELKLSIAAATVLYDNFIMAILPYMKNGKLRRLVNNDNLEVDHLIGEMSDHFEDSGNFHDYRSAAKIYKAIRSFEERNPDLEMNTFEENNYLNTLIDSSFAIHEVSKISQLDRIRYRLTDSHFKVFDFFAELGSTISDRASMAFGNTVGLSETRKGKLTSLNKSEVENLKAQMAPLDILLEKTPFRLTDKFIPGHWGHVAVWVGNQEQLEALGVWEQLPAIEMKLRSQHRHLKIGLQDAVKSGRFVLEALRPGVVINSFEHFLNIDDLAVLRDFTMDDGQKRDFLIKAFHQVGKEYDFNFNVETDDKIVCSELAYVVFTPGYNWPTEEVAGRATINPDHVGKLSKDGLPFFPITLYHNGQKIAKNLLQNFNFLLEENYKAVEVAKHVKY